MRQLLDAAQEAMVEAFDVPYIDPIGVENPIGCT